MDPPAPRTPDTDHHSPERHTRNSHKTPPRRVYSAATAARMRVPPPSARSQKPSPAPPTKKSPVAPTRGIHPANLATETAVAPSMTDTQIQNASCRQAP